MDPSGGGPSKQANVDFSFIFSVDSPSRMYNGPAKSNPVWANGGFIDTKSGVGGGVKRTHSTLLKFT